MKHIPKNHLREPQSLRDFRENTSGARYDDFRGAPKQELREVLTAEQGFLCAYCMRRIKADHKSMEIEHFISQNRHPNSPHPEETHHDHELRYQNLLGTCNGERSCSEIRGNWPLTIDPRFAACERLIKFKKNGTAYSEDARIQSDIVELALNNLADARAEVIEKARKEIELLSPNRTWDNALLDSEITRWKSRKTTRHGSAFEPYCMAAVQYLESKKR